MWRMRHRRLKTVSIENTTSNSSKVNCSNSHRFKMVNHDVRESIESISSRRARISKPEHDTAQDRIQPVRYRKSIDGMHTGLVQPALE